MKKLNNKDIEIAVEIDGVYAQGFGMLAQKVMLEKELPLQSKAIYAYLASYAGSGKIYPKRSTILRDLNMNKDTYYKYLNRLVEKSYISISKKWYYNLIYISEILRGILGIIYFNEFIPKVKIEY